MKVSTIGMDTAKNVFHVIGLDARGHEVMKKKLRRRQVAEFFANLEPCVVGIEACSGAHHWGRTLGAFGHQTPLVTPRSVKAYVPGAKNDYNDARGICEALSRPTVRKLTVKTVAQQDLQALHRLRSAAVRQRTALVNRLRGLLAEYGLVMPKGIGHARRQIPELLEDAENGLSGLFRELLAEQYEELVRLDQQVRIHDRRVKQAQREHDGARRLGEVRGLGPLCSTALAAHLGDGRQFSNGRGFAASLGLVPHQHSSGGDPRLLGISKRGDPYLRWLLVNGARSVLEHAPGKEDRLSRWVLALSNRRGFNVAAVALANKLARIAWAIIAHNRSFDPARA